MELRTRGIRYIREVLFEIPYRGATLKTRYKVDFVCSERVLVELKALPSLTGLEEAQVLNYLKASRLKTALLLNFGTASLQHRRMVL